VITDPLASACRELRRLIGLPHDVDAATLAHLFSDPRRAEDLYRPRTSGELREVFGPQRFGPQGHAPAPSAETIAAALTAFWRWARVGFGVVEPATLARRLETCQSCEHYVEAPRDVLHALARRAASESKVCACCGCFVRKKARLATEACPTGRW
jgi:hypothetical protein